MLYRPFRHGSIPPVWVNPFVRALPGLGASCNSRMCCWDFCCSRQMTLWQPPALIGETLLASAWELIRNPLTQWSCQAQLIIFSTLRLMGSHPLMPLMWPKKVNHSFNRRPHPPFTHLVRKRRKVLDPLMIAAYWASPGHPGII